MNFSMNNKVTLFCDNKSSILMSKSNENSKRAKHIDIKNHFLKDVVNDKILDIDYISSENNLADIFTKSLSKELFIRFRNQMNMS